MKYSAPARATRALRFAPLGLLALLHCGLPTEDATPSDDTSALGIVIPLPHGGPKTPNPPPPSGNAKLGTAPLQVIFGQICPGAQGSHVVRLENRGGTPLTISALSVTGTRFSVTTGAKLPLQVAPGGSVPVTVKYHAPSGVSTSSLVNGTLHIGSNDAAHPTTNLALRVILAQPTLALSSHEIDFGQESAGASDRREVTLRNAGVCPTVISSVDTSGSGAGQISVPALPPSALRPGESYRLQVQLDCSHAGDILADLGFLGPDGEQLSSAQITGLCE